MPNANAFLTAPCPGAAADPRRPLGRTFFTLWTLWGNPMSDDMTTDPLATVADAMENAVQAARDGVMDARAKAEQALPQIGRFAARFVYTTSYALSYGVVFPTVLAARSIPRDNAIVHGLKDGADAAIDMLDDMRRRRLNQEVAPPVQTF